jgi:hypothetical protein
LGEGVVQSHDILGWRGGVLLVRAGSVEEHSLRPSAADVRRRRVDISARKKAEGASTRDPNNVSVQPTAFLTRASGSRTRLCRAHGTSRPGNVGEAS